MATKRNKVEPSPGDGEAWENRPSDPRPPGPIRLDGLACMVAGVLIGGVVLGLGWITFGNPAPPKADMTKACDDTVGYHCIQIYTEMTLEERIAQQTRFIEGLQDDVKALKDLPTNKKEQAKVDKDQTNTQVTITTYRGGWIRNDGEPMCMEQAGFFVPCKDLKQGEMQYNDNPR